VSEKRRLVFDMVSLINLLVTILSFLVFGYVIVSWVLSPYHPVRETLDRIVEPLLMPIRRLLPYIGGLDFSPFVLLILIQLIGRLIIILIVS
jgi:YggT family protein